MHLHVPAACALYDAPEDGCILHPKHVEQGKCNKVTLNNLHQAGLNKPILFCSIILFYSILFYSILFSSTPILFYSTIFYTTS